MLCYVTGNVLCICQKGNLLAAWWSRKDAIAGKTGMNERKKTHSKHDEWGRPGEGCGTPVA